MTATPPLTDLRHRSRWPAQANRNSFRTRLLRFATALFVGCCYMLLDYGVSNSHEKLTAALLLAIGGLMALVAANTGSAPRFLFSCAFWVTIEFFFYIILKAVAIANEIEPGPLQMALLASFLFLAGFLLGQWLWPIRSLAGAPTVKARDGAPHGTRLYWWLVLSFIGFKLLLLFLLTTVDAGDTALDVSRATQNQGAAYLFKIPTLAQGSYFLVLLFAYKHGLYRRTAVVMTLWILFEGVIGAARYSLITTILINLLLCHLYIHPVRLSMLALIAPPLVFLVTFFGYVRNIELANTEVYAAALSKFSEERELMLQLFMSRLDMLPQMAEAFRMDQVGLLKNEAGMSYVYSLLHAIPRNLWEAKPPLTAAYVTELVNPFVFADGVNIYPSIMLEAYMNFLWPGALIIGVVIAWMCRVYEQALLFGSLRAQAFALLAFTFPMGLINEGIHSNIFASLIYLIAIYAIWLMATQAIVGRRHAARLAMP